MNEPRALLIDLDGVIRYWDDQSPRVERKYALAAGTIARVAFHRDRLYPAITGKVTDAAWRASIAEALSIELPETDIFAAVDEWSTPCGRIDPDMVSLLRFARIQMKIVLVTNATSRLSNDLLQLGLVDEFDAIINSSAVGSAKPEQGIFLEALKTAGVSANEALFVDDQAVNVLAARALGITGYCFTGTNRLARQLGIPWPQNAA